MRAALYVCAAMLTLAGCEVVDGDDDGGLGQQGTDDGGVEVDVGGLEADAGAADDAGLDLDAGVEADGSAADDQGVEVDEGVEVDAGEEADAAPPVDIEAYEDLPAATALMLAEQERKVLPGTSTDPTDGHAPQGGMDGPDEVGAADSVGDLAVAALYDDEIDFYFTDGRYNATNFPVTRSTLAGLGEALPAYTVEPPQNGPSEFLGTRHGLFYRFDQAVDWTVYELVDGALNAVRTLAAADVNAGGYTHVGDANVDGPRTFVFARADRRVSTFTALDDGAEGARVANNAVGRIVQVRFPLPGAPRDTVAAYPHGPGTWENTYGQQRGFHSVRRDSGPGLVWQDVDSGQLRVTWLSDDDPNDFSTVDLPGGQGNVLAGASAEGDGSVTCLLVGAGDGRMQDAARAVTVIRASAAGEEERRNVLAGDRDGLNVALFNLDARGSNQAVMRRSGDRLAVFMARFMLRANDGLNHQASIGFVLDAETLEYVGRPWQTSSHAWANVLMPAANDGFLGADLGDNFPRGVHLHRVGADGSLASRIVFTLKTQHGTEARSPAGRTYPVYEEISDEEQTFYRWSNDNRTYTELGGVAATDEGIVVLFATERSLLNNAVVGGDWNETRELAMVRVRSDWQPVEFGGEGHVVTDDLVLSRGQPAVESRFYGFTGGENRQRVAGVVFLTDLADDESASRPKLHSTDAGLVALYERWQTQRMGNGYTNRYLGTHALRLGHDGLPVAGAEATLGARLSNRDDPFTLAGGTAIATGRKNARELLVTLILPAGE